MPCNPSGNLFVSYSVSPLLQICNFAIAAPFARYVRSMAALFLFPMARRWSIGSGAEKGVPLLFPKMAILASGRTGHFFVATGATLVVGTFKPGPVLVVGFLVLFPKGCS
jgi:hypothetical protein